MRSIDEIREVSDDCLIELEGKELENFWFSNSEAEAYEQATSTEFDG